METLHSPPPSPPAPHVTSSPFPYSAAFTDQLMSRLLDELPSPFAGITVLPPGVTPRGRTPARTLRFSDVSTSDLAPPIPSPDVPLDLEDPRRIYTSLVPGVLVTHVGGRLEGGAPLATDAAHAAVRAFVSARGVAGREELQRLVRGEAEAAAAELTQRMRERREAQEENERLARQVEELRAQRDMERKVEEKMRREWKSRDEDD